MDNILYFEDMSRHEHDSDTPCTKRVSIYGWNSDTLSKTRIGSNEDGEMLVSNPNEEDSFNQLVPMMRTFLMAIANPSYVDKSANAIRNRVQSGTITTVSTVTNMTNLNGNFGSFAADHLQRMDNRVAWATSVRSLIT